MGTQNGNQSGRSIEKLSKNISPLLNEFVISKVCGTIEMKLRVDVHDNLQLLQKEPMVFDACNSNLTIPISGANRLLASKLIPLLRTTNSDDRNIHQYMSVQDRVR